MLIPTSARVLEKQQTQNDGPAITDGTNHCMHAVGKVGCVWMHKATDAR